MQIPEKGFSPGEKIPENYYLFLIQSWKNENT
jgi:hypothetical protein